MSQSPIPASSTSPVAEIHHGRYHPHHGTTREEQQGGLVLFCPPYAPWSMEVVLIKKDIPQLDFCGLCLTESHIAIFPLLGDTWKSNLLFAKPLICRNSTLRVSANKSVKKIPNFDMQNLSIPLLHALV